MRKPYPLKKRPYSKYDTMKSTLYILLFSFLAAAHLQAQNLDKDPNVIFMKAQVLFDQERYDEAVRIYNQILTDNEEFAQAYLMRAKSKFQLGAHKGTKADIMDFIALNGVTKEVIKIMSQTEQQLGNLKAAMNYTNVAIELDPYDSELYLIKGYLHLVQDDKSEACELWTKSSKLGDKRATAMLKEHCALIIEMKEMQEKEKETEAKRHSDELPNENNTDNIVLADKKEKDESPEEEDDAVVKKEDSKATSPIFDEPDRDAIQEVEIDEELSVVIGNGLGERKLDSNPDMFIISSTKGKVVIDVCVNGKGKVTSSKINKKLTTLFKTSLTSLALRKSKEFVFYPSFRDEQCGYLIFVIDPQE